MSNPLLEDYLGDGVYASFHRSGDIVLDLRAQPPTPNNAIVLEPRTLLNFDRFRANCELLRGREES